MKFAHYPLLLGLALGLAMVLASPPAHAQGHVVSDTPDGYAIEFTDGKLLGQSLDLQGHVIRIRKGAARALLIRPRASFVRELSYSIEDL